MALMTLRFILPELTLPNDSLISVGKIRRRVSSLNNRLPASASKFATAVAGLLLQADDKSKVVRQLLTNDFASVPSSAGSQRLKN